ncbi:MAG: DUF167 domain-containing protein [Candidatus Omnitrophica bacterium]|nr:DUF167 domain-containing protein [Candidatus Omnitrophota bacterium]
MNISVKVKPNSKENKIEKVKDNAFILRVKQAAKEGRANEAAVKLLSEFFDIPKSRIAIISGHKSKNKIIGLEGI